MLKRLLTITIIVLFASSCSDRHSKQVIKVDLKEIRKKGKLTVLFENSTLSYFEYRGKKMGFEFELLKAFAKEIKVESNRNISPTTVI